MKIRLATYNIHKGIGVDRRFRPERIARILEAHDADVVLLQEVDEDVPRSRRLNLANELAKALDYPFFVLGHNVKLKMGRYGNATLSRFPILRERNIDLTLGKRKRRGCQHVTLELKPSPAASSSLEIFNLHLGLSARERQKQAELLIASPELQELSDQCHCVIGGDFNDWRSLLRPFFVEGQAFRCASDRMTKKGVRALKTFPSFAPRGGLDRIYYRGGLELVHSYCCRHRESRVASDHLPLIAEFDLDLDPVVSPSRNQ